MNAVIHIPPDFSLITDTISSSAGSINSSGNTITWTAGSDTGVPISAAYLVTAPLLSVAQSIPTLVVLSDGLSNLTLLHEYVFLVPHQLYLPSIANEN
jgi:hypothetical protein